jgi:flagellar biosynthesis/type III secretory pathway protein FliH
MTKRLIDATEATAHIKRHCTAAIERAAFKRVAPADGALVSKRPRMTGLSPPAPPPGPSPERVQGRQEGWVEGHKEGLEEGRRKAAESFATDVVPEMERLVRIALDELNSHYDSMFLEICREFGECGGGRPPRFMY